MNIFGPQSPEELEEAKKRELAARVRSESTVRDALPILREVRRGLRELVGLGITSSYLAKAMKNTALLDDILELELHRPPPGDAR